MPRWTVTERQWVSCTWEVEADSEQEAVDSAQEGVPEDADERLMKWDV